MEKVWRFFFTLFPNPVLFDSDRTYQNSQHWKDHFSFFQSLAASLDLCFHAVDLLGHGQSSPIAENSSSADVFKIQIEILEDYLINGIKGEKDIVFIGRSYGGIVTLHITMDFIGKKSEKNVIGLIWIAPALVTEQSLRYVITNA
jgi:pimeloyl-ACP methyl ester carboxylesterase